MIYIFNTKIVEDEHRNGQVVEIIDRDTKNDMVLIEFPDGTQKWVYSIEIIHAIS